VTPHRHAPAVTEYPSALEIVTTRDFDAPVELVFDVLTKPRAHGSEIRLLDDYMIRVRESTS